MSWSCAGPICTSSGVALVRVAASPFQNVRHKQVRRITLEAGRACIGHRSCFSVHPCVAWTLSSVRSHGQCVLPCVPFMLCPS